MALVKEPHDHKTVQVFIMLYIVSKVNENEWFSLHGWSIMLASHHNGSITPHVAKWPNGQKSNRWVP